MPSSTLQNPVLAVVAVFALAHLGSARGHWSEDADFQTYEHEGACLSNADEIALMQVSMLQTAQHVRSAAEPARAMRRSQNLEESWLVGVATMLGRFTVLTESSREADGRTDKSWLAGVFMALLGMTTVVLGLQLQKLAHNVQTSNSSIQGVGDQKPGLYFLQWRWIIGAIVFLLGHSMCFIALGLAPQSILSCLQSWSIIMALALAPILLKEALPPRAIEYAGVLITGCLIVVMFGPRPDHLKLQKVHTLEMSLFAPCAMIVHLICFGLMTFAIAMSFVRQNLLRVERYVLMAAICAWYAVFCSKSMSILAIDSVASHQSQAHIMFWVLTLFFVCCAVGQAHFMNLGLKHGLASAVMPMYEAVSMIGQLFFGGIVFAEFENFQSRRQLFGFATGVFIVLFGLALLLRSNARAKTAYLTPPSSEAASKSCWDQVATK